MSAVLGRKGVMTQIHDEQGRVVPVTPIAIGNCMVIAKRTVQRHGYQAVQLGLGMLGEKHTSKPMAGYFRKLGVTPVKVLREIRVDDAESYEPGKQVDLSSFVPGDRVRVEGYTKGRGFTGGIKRWGWHGQPRTHGSMTHRRVGSVGAGTTPGRVLPGRALPGHYGVEKVVVRNLRVVRIETERGIIYIKGAVPGHRGSLVVVRKGD